MEILNKILEEIKPTKEYQLSVLTRAKNIIDKLNKNLKDAKAVLGGSGAKGTWIETFDADIFVKYNYNKYKDKSEDLSEILEKVMKRTFIDFDRIHGSRDYFQINVDDFTFEIVPILDIKKAEQAKNITDVSPLHTKWVLKHKKYREQVRLTKKFCKAQKVYGAESHIKGFSGYVCEILTIYYGSFIELIKNAAKWKEKQIIDVEGYYKGKDVFMILNKSKLVAPLIVIDPVQADRNAAAALSFENFDKFRDACKKFIRKPSKDMFKENKISIEKIKEENKDKKVIVIEAELLEGKKDIAGCKIIKIFEYMLKKITQKGFKIFDFGINFNGTALFYFVLDNMELTKEEEIEGPPIELKDHVKEFKKKHKQTSIKNDKIYALEKREYTKPEKLIKDLLQEKYVKERAKAIKCKE